MAVSLCSWLACSPSGAAQAAKQKMVYEVYAGGIHALRADLTIDVRRDGTYDLSLAARSRGLLGKLAPWHGTFESKGVRSTDDRFVTQLHRSITTWREEEETKIYRYNRDGSFISLDIDEHDRPVRTETPDAALTDRTVDALTATLGALYNVSNQHSCEGVSNVFDGKRRFKQQFNTKGAEALIASRYNIYEGQAYRCTVEVKPDGGAWHKKPRGWLSIQEQGRKKGTMPTLWAAQLADGEPAVPVKLLVKTDYGTLYVHLTEYHRPDGTILLTEKRERGLNRAE